MKDRKEEMRKILWITVLLLLVVNTLYSEEKKYLSIEERKRTLSLPPKTWKIDAGAEFYYGMENDSFEIEFDADLTNIQFPYLSLGNRAELHFFTPICKIYPVKNVTEQDSFLIANGVNFALLGGLTGMWYSSRDGFGLSYGIGYQFKTMMGVKAWLFSNGLGILDLENDWTSKIAVGTGFQITKKFSIILSLHGSLYEYIVRYIDTGREESYLGYTLKVPIDFKINKNRRNGFMLRTGFKYRANTFNDVTFWGIPIGVQYSWHW